MNKDSTCGNCKFWQDLQQGMGICRKSPPGAAVVTVQPQYGGPPQPQVITFWPQTKGIDYCGEWEVNLYH